jgi:hypothetical protein
MTWSLCFSQFNMTQYDGSYCLDVGGTGLSTGAIVGIVIAAVVVLFIVIAAFLCCCCL